MTEGQVDVELNEISANTEEPTANSNHDPVNNRVRGHHAEGQDDIELNQISPSTEGPTANSNLDLDIDQVRGQVDLEKDESEGSEPDVFNEKQPLKMYYGQVKLRCGHYKKLYQLDDLQF